MLLCIKTHLAGLEPATARLEIWYSIQLSYRCKGYLTLAPFPLLEVLEAALPFFLKTLEVLGLPILILSAIADVS